MKRTFVFLFVLFVSSNAFAVPFSVFQGVYRGEGDFRQQAFSYSAPSGCVMTVYPCPEGFVNVQGVCMSVPFQSFVLVPLNCDTENMPLGTGITDIVQLLSSPFGGGVIHYTNTMSVNDIDDFAKSFANANMPLFFDCPLGTMMDLATQQYVIEAYSTGSNASVSLFVYRTNSCSVTDISQTVPSTNTQVLTEEEQSLIDRLKGNFMLVVDRFKASIISKFDIQPQDTIAPMSFYVFDRDIVFNFNDVPYIGAIGDLIYNFSVFLASLYVIKG